MPLGATKDEILLPVSRSTQFCALDKFVKFFWTSSKRVWL